MCGACDACACPLLAAPVAPRLAPPHLQVSGARQIDAGACTLGLIPDVEFKVVDEFVRQFYA